MNIKGKEIQESRPKIEHPGERKKENKRLAGSSLLPSLLSCLPRLPPACPSVSRCCLRWLLSLLFVVAACARCALALFCFSSRATTMDVFFISVYSSSCSCSSSPTTPAASLLRLRGVSLLVIIALSGGEFFCLCVFLCPLLCLVDYVRVSLSFPLLLGTVFECLVGFSKPSSFHSIC